MVRFLIGRTGCGKTYQIVNKIAAFSEQTKTKLFLIVPEQQLYSTERELFSRISARDMENLSILSFTRLCDFLEDTYGGKSSANMSQATASLLMWQNLRELQGLLETYGSSRYVDVAMTRLMMETVQEISNNGISPVRLETVANRLDLQSPLYAKLRDIALVSASYHNLLLETCGNNPTERMIRCAQKAADNGFFCHAHIYVDSFASFTAQEYAILDVMLSQAEDVTITLGMDSPTGTEPQFHSVRDTYARLAGLAREKELPVETEILSTQHRKVEKELSLLESALWNFSLPPFKMNVIADNEKGHIRLLTAPTPYDEAEAVALQMLELAEQGVPYGEMAVVVRDANQWKGILDAALEQYHIPYFLSERTDLNTKPAARLLLLALRCISRRFQSGDILSLCKTGLCGITPRDLDYFEEYIETWKLTGRRMTEAWSMNPDGYTTDWSQRGQEILEAANRVREQVMTPLMTLDIQLKAAMSPTEQCKAVYEYLCALSVKKQLSAQAEELLTLGRIREAEENVRLWTFLVDTLASISNVLPETSAPLTAEELSQVLSLIFAETDIGSVPARHDCVTVGSANILRVDNISATFVLGLCEGEFPRGANAGGLFSEQDRETLKENGVELDAREDRLIAEELLYVYRAMSKPSDYLYLSHSMTQTDGKALSPSAAFTRVTYLFPYLKVTSFHPRWIHPVNPHGYMPPMHDKLSPPRVQSMLGNEIWLSQSKIQRYAHCPYSYFGTHVLKLRQRNTATWENNHSGSFLHHVMEQFLRTALDEGGKFRPLEDDEISKTADTIIAEYVNSLCGDISENGRLQHIFARLRAIAIVLLHSIVSELRQSSFLPVGLEWDTHGFKDTDPSPLILPLHEEIDLDDVPLPVGISKSAPVQLKLGGVVDRVDVYRTDDGKKVYIRVVDYKSSKHEFSEQIVAEKRDIQLLLYLFTLCAEQNRKLFADKDGRIPDVVLPAQAMYISPEEDNKKGMIKPLRTGMILGEEEILKAASDNLDAAFLPCGISRDKSGELKGKALYSKENVESLERLLHRVILEQAAAMYGGDACRTPSPDGCLYCNLRGSCPVAAEKPSYS